MEPFRYHVFVCMQEKPEGVPCCAASRSGQVLGALHGELAKQGLANDVQVTGTGCMGFCDDGPVVIAYPEGTWYARVSAEDVPELVVSHFGAGKPLARLARTDTGTIKAAILEHTEKYLAMVKARDAAGILPDDLNEMIRGFMSSRAVLTALELDVFTAIGQGATAKDLAARINCDPRGTEMLLNALVSLKLLQKSDGNFQNTPASARYFVAGSADNHRPALMHTAHLWDGWSTLTDAVRAGTRIAGEHEEGWVTAFIAAMDRNARDRAAQVVKAVGADAVRRMLDLGGGSGAYSMAFARAVPGLCSHIVDLADVLPLTQSYIQNAGLEDRISVRAGDMLTAPLGAGYDLVLLSAICHMFSPAQNLELFRRAYAALVPGGRLVVQDFILNPDKTSPRQAALFALNMLVGTKAGATYSEPEYAEWLREAGFAEVKRVRLPGPAGLMIATRG
jgi:(2Fe-2S) ferredoxin/predicted O-methyltransferase YrrM